MPEDIYFFGTSASLDMPPYLWIENHTSLIKGGVILPDGSVDFAQAKPATNADLKDGKCGSASRHGAYDPNFLPKDYMQIQSAKVQQYVAEHANTEKPFFIYIPMPAPHMPWAVQERFKQSSSNYLAQTDHYTGEIINALDDPNGDGDTSDSVKANTVVLITSDNGPAGKAHSSSLKNGHDANGPFAGVKTDSWEGGTRVPFIVHWPGVVEAGAVSNHACWQGDFIPTIAEYLGYELGEDQAPDTESFLPVLQGRSMPAERRAGFIVHSARGEHAIIGSHGDWKLLDGSGSGGNKSTWDADDELVSKAAGIGGPSRQLYRLSKDSGERNNLLLKPNELTRAKEKELWEALKTIRGND